jgi:flagellar hook-associated protein 3 FlgL
MTADNAVYNLQQGRAAMDSLQEQISSGLIVNKPSDNPLTTRQLLDLQNQIAAGDQYTSNITKGSMFLNLTSTALGAMSDLMTQVSKAAGSMANGTTDPIAQDAAVSNLANIRGQLIDLGNTKFSNQYIFAGFKNSQPFDADGNFSGTNDLLNTEISPGSQVATNVAGGDLLRGGTPPATVGTSAAGTAGAGPIDILGSIDALITAIKANPSDTAGIAYGIKNLNAATGQINASLIDVGGRLSRLDNMKGMIANNQNTLKGIYGDMQNVDLTKAGVELSQQTTAFSAALATTAKLNQLTLLDYMK